MVAVTKASQVGMYNASTLALAVSASTPIRHEPAPIEADRLGPFVAAEAIAPCDLVYINSSGQIARSNGTSANAAAKCDGICLEGAASGQSVYIYHNITVEYGSSLTPGARYFVDTAAGGLSTTATTGGTAAVAMAVSPTAIYVWQSKY